MSKNNNEVILFVKLRNLFKRKPKVKKDDIGIYTDMFSHTTIGNSTHLTNYDVNIKVKAVAVFDGLVEVEVISLNINEAISEEVEKLIRHDKLKYLDPNKVKWEIK